MSSTPTPEHEVAAATWAALAPRMAANGTLRLSRDGGKNYRRANTRRVTTKLPNQPAALMVYNDHATAPLIALDLDTTRGDVEHDHATITRHLNRLGCVWFSDHSPNGGRHIYIPLTTPAPLHEARAVALGLAALAPTLDVSPMSNAQSGCIRPPGALHRTGGHQVLDGNLRDAIAALEVPTTDAAWQRLLTELGLNSEITPTRAPLRRASAALAGGRAIPRPHSEVEESLDALRGFTSPDASYLNIARTGAFDTSRYRSPSEARQAVVWAAVASGWTFDELVRRLEDGTWAGLRSLYARYPSHHQHAAVVGDWRAAIDFEKQRRQSSHHKSVRICTTSPRKSRGGGPLPPPPSVREWLTAVDHLCGPGTDLSVRAVLYALAQAAVLSGSLVIEHGNRHLALATGKMHRTTLGRALQQLLDAPADRALIDLVAPARGLRANAYSLTIPPLLRAACAAKPWRRGRIHGIRPAFRELGYPAAFAYAALEQQDTPLTGRGVATAARLSPTAANEALHTLHAWGLAHLDENRLWSIGTANLEQLADAWGIAEEIQKELHHYRTERAQWRAWLAARGIITDPNTPPPPPDPDPWPSPPHDDTETAAELVQRVLGARIVA